MFEAAPAERLAGRLRGRLIRPADGDYDEARRVWNGMVDRRPALVVRCAGAADVTAAIDFARDHELMLSVKGGGHCVSGKAVCDGGLVIDLSRMSDVRVDPRSATARVAGGATWGAVDHETQAFGLAVTGGIDSRTGVAGLTLDGGIGYLARSQGLTIDNLVSAELVLADGRRVTASDDEHPDLFWALRGGGGGLGVVTSLEFRLREVGPEVMTAQVFHTMDAAADVLAFYRDFMCDTADAVACYPLFVHIPPVEPFPKELHGATCLALVACHAGSLEEGRAALAALGAFGAPMLAAVAPMPYATLQRSFDGAAPDGARFYWKAHTLDELTDDAIATLVDRVDPLPGPFSVVFIESLGGAISRVDQSATAYPHRSAQFGFGISAGWQDPAADEAAIAWTRSLCEAMAPHASGGVYVDYLDHDDDRADAAHVGNLTRLREVRRMYDPDGVFVAAVSAAYVV